MILQSPLENRHITASAINALTPGYSRNNSEADDENSEDSPDVHHQKSVYSTTPIKPAPKKTPKKRSSRMKVAKMGTPQRKANVSNMGNS